MKAPACQQPSQILIAKCEFSHSSFSLETEQKNISTQGFSNVNKCSLYTGKYLSEALILASTNPQYDDRLFTELPVQYMKTTSSEHVVYINCSECQKQFLYTTCSPQV